MFLALWNECMEKFELENLFPCFPFNPLCIFDPCQRSNFIIIGHTHTNTYTGIKLQSQLLLFRFSSQLLFGKIKCQKHVITFLSYLRIFSAVAAHSSTSFIKWYGVCSRRIEDDVVNVRAYICVCCVVCCIGDMPFFCVHFYLHIFVTQWSKRVHYRPCRCQQPVAHSIIDCMCALRCVVCGVWCMVWCRRPADCFFFLFLLWNASKPIAYIYIYIFFLKERGVGKKLPRWWIVEAGRTFVCVLNACTGDASYNQGVLGEYAITTSVPSKSNLYRTQKLLAPDLIKYYIFQEWCVKHVCLCCSRFHSII